MKADSVHQISPSRRNLPFAKFSRWSASSLRSVPTSSMLDICVRRISPPNDTMIPLERSVHMHKDFHISVRDNFAIIHTVSWPLKGAELFLDHR